MNAELPGIDHVDEVCKELEKKIDTVQEATKGHLKAAKVSKLWISFSTCTRSLVGRECAVKYSSLN